MLVWLIIQAYFDNNGNVCITNFLNNLNYVIEAENNLQIFPCEFISSEAENSKTMAKINKKGGNYLTARSAQRRKKLEKINPNI